MSDYSDILWKMFDLFLLFVGFDIVFTEQTN